MWTWGLDELHFAHTNLVIWEISIVTLQSHASFSFDHFENGIGKELHF